ncbi:hypothetical protein HI113_35000 [Corallococcus exiguus]|uniref:hypothetical protein n=1 Tax=Corallococcus exiguus TaxID=83462 RepID=UPI001474A221|nr:hypothetical protein [Corallococcus exiguus]NNB99114.1 hypothetical protein [Corallococcus exiguus]
MIVGVSISESPDLLRFGVSDLHLHDAMSELARYLLATGYRLAYGGDLRPSGFTYNLKSFAEMYAGASTKPPILNFLACYVWKSFPAADLAELSTVGQLECLPEPAEAQATPRPSESYLRSRSLTEMRQAMNQAIGARVLLGGRTTEFSGRMPGLVEEAWLAVEASKPLYLLGAFGGCTGEVIRAIQGERPEMFSTEFQAAQTAGHTALLQEYDARLGAGEGTSSLTRALESFQKLGVAGLTRLNGLSEEENLLLFSSREPPVPDMAAALVLQGLQQVRERKPRA